MRSNGFPSSNACSTAAIGKAEPHCGARDPRKNNQVRGTHKAAEVLGSGPVEPEKSQEQNKP